MRQILEVESMATRMTDLKLFQIGHYSDETMAVRDAASLVLIALAVSMRRDYNEGGGS